MRTGILLSMALMLANTAIAGESINESRPLASDGDLQISNVKGEIRVTAWDRDEVEITGELGRGVEKLEIRGSGQRLSIEVKNPRKSRKVEGTDLYIRAPKGVNVKIDSVSADVEVTGISGQKMSVDSVSGEVQLDVSPQRLSIETVSGDIELEGDVQRTKIETVSGDMEITGQVEEIQLNSVSGEAILEVNGLADGRFESVSGDLTLNVALVSGAELKTETVSGDLDLLLTKKVSVDLEITSFSGDIDSEFGRVIEAKYGPGKNLSYRSDSADVRIDINNFSGDVEVHEG